MAQLLVICLILADAFVALSMANEMANSFVELKVASVPNTPATSPSGEGKPAEAPAIRKLGRHQLAAPCPSPSEAPQMEGNMHSTKQVGSTDQAVQGQEVYIKKQHHSIDKSVAGGGVILGVLATTFLVAVFCYIRATGRKNAVSSVHPGSSPLSTAK